MPIRFQVGLPGPFVWQRKDRGARPERTGRDILVTTTEYERPEFAWMLHREAVGMARWIGAAWTIWSLLFVVSWVWQGDWARLGWSLFAWWGGLALLALWVRSRRRQAEREEELAA